jgi:hypothetical protein
MGLLDDAIREHLDLKRRRGADPNEMEKLEREALGPVRRAPEQPDDVPVQADADEERFEDAAPEWSEPALEEDELVPEPEPELDPAPPAAEAAGAAPGGSFLFDHEADAGAAASESPAAEPFADEPPTAETPAAATPPPAPAPVPPSAEPAAPPEPGVEPLEPDHLNEETAEYDVEAEHAREKGAHGEHPEGGAREGEDVLEETPEFLQDTPDHDRLWFEQRPPRDFDFDE